MKKIYLLLLIVTIFPINSVFANSGDRIHGYIWSDTIGWISLNCSDYNYCDTSNYGVDVSDDGSVTGNAWSDNVGWISFDYCHHDTSCTGPTYNQDSGKMFGDIIVLSGLLDTEDGWDGKIVISDFSGSPAYGPITSNGNFSGYSWGSNIIGWVLWDNNAFLDNFSLTFTADKGISPTNKAPYQSNILLEWQTTDNATSCTPTAGAGTDWTTGNLPRGVPSGTHPILSLENDTDFTLTCNDADSGNSVQKDLHIYVQPPAPTIILGVDDDNISYNTATNLNWSTENVASCVMEGPGDFTPPPTSTSVSPGSNQSITTGNLTNADNSFTLTCQPTDTVAYPNDVSANVNVSVGKLIVDFSVENNPIPYNSSFELIWDTEYATLCSASAQPDLKGSGGNLLTKFSGVASSNDGEHHFSSEIQIEEGKKYIVRLQCQGNNGQFFDETIPLKVGKNPLFMEN